MNEHSMEVFSKEMMGLNAMLEKAQRIAHLGYWTYDGLSDQIVWSKESYQLFDTEKITIPTTYHGFMELVHEQDKEELKNKVEKALSDKVDYEFDFRIKVSNGEYKWFQTIGQSTEGEKQLTGIIIDIHKKKSAEEKIKELNNQIVSTARRAGMVEVATSILHNIGNILNSSNVSISLIKKGILHTYQERFIRIVGMLNAHKENLADFLINDPKGQVIPQYISSLSSLLDEEQKRTDAEIDALINDLNHIKEIVAMQESLSGQSHIKEKVYIPELISTALNISIVSDKDKQIEIVKEFDPCPLINADKSRLLQIFINLIQNARDSTNLIPDNPYKEIKLIVKKYKKDLLQVRIEDNGIGIDKANLSRIFAFGFTTKENGHGFGLHRSALAAQEMGGSLKAESSGAGCGAQFILMLPIKNTSGTNGVFNE